MVIIVLIVGIIVGYSIGLLLRMSKEADDLDFDYAFKDNDDDINKHIPRID